MFFKTSKYIKLFITVFFLSVTLINNGQCDVQGENQYNETDKKFDTVFPERERFNLSETINIRDTNNGVAEQLKYWYPWSLASYHINDIGILNDDDLCIDRSPIDDFPDDLFTQEQRLQGAIILHFIGAIFAFVFMTIVVDSYFIPTVWCICEDLKLPPDLAAATFMATATAMPECFTNFIAIFVTQSDMGIGTVIGSLLFNTVGVGALLGLSASKTLKFDWWPLTRDCFIFFINISVLSIVMWDSHVQWYEAMILVIMLCCYYIFMSFNAKSMKVARRLCEEKWRLCQKTSYDFGEPLTITSEDIISPDKSIEKVNELVYIIPEPIQEQYIEERIILRDPNEPVYKMIIKYPIDNDLQRVWMLPKCKFFSIFWFIFTWPIRFLLSITLFDPRKHRRLYPITFIVCIVWIALIAYKIFWMLTVIGYTFGIPDSVMGLTFLAAGGCTPEATAAIIMARKGEAAMGLSNSLGTASLNILMSLGLPWFIRTMIIDAKGYRSPVNVKSHGMEFTILSLILAIILVYVILTLTKYRLNKRTGFIFMFVYITLLTFAILVEVDVFFPSGNVC